MKSPLGRLKLSAPPTYQDKLADLIRQEKSEVVVETGVWEGLSTEYILKAMDDNGFGRLYSIDPMDPDQEFNGTKGNPELFFSNPISHFRWRLLRARSDQVLEVLFEEVGPFDMFIHDSDHGFECQKFEYDAAWRMVRSGGIIVTDDPYWGIPPHRAWDKFLIQHGLTDVRIMGTAQWVRKP